LIAPALNHLLRQQAWARARLAPFAGEIVEVTAGPLPRIKLAIEPDGLVAEAPADAAASLLVTLKPEAPAAFVRGEEHFLRAVEVSGNARLASEVMALARELRWDFEEDLSRLVGDVAAHRAAESLRALAGWQRDTVRRLAESFADYAAQETRLLVARSELDELARGAAALRDALERLDQRMRRLG
jgi:ubiquinone biosynthesis protein UbiJ